MAIELTDERDIAFAGISQRAKVRRTVLPSGYETPDEQMFIVGTSLLTVEEYRKGNHTGGN
jgi:hypothetical protein